MRIVRVVFAVLLCSILLIAILQNTDVVTLRFIVWETQVSQVVLLPLTLLCGIVIGWLGIRIFDYRRTRPVRPSAPADTVPRA